MLGLITSLSQVVYTTAQSGHITASNSAHKNRTLQPKTQQELDNEKNKASRVKELKFKAISKSNMPTQDIYYAPPHSVTTNENPPYHKIMYMAYEWENPEQGGNNTMNLANTFIFPFPAGINDKVTTEWDDETSMIKRLTAALVTSDKKIGDQLKKDAQSKWDNLTSGSRRKVAEFNQADFYFKSVAKRDFTFSHKMTPQSETESVVMKDIVDWIQYHASPLLKKTNVQLIGPAEWEIHFLSNGVDNPFLPKIKRCILESVAINDTPNDSFQSSENSHPNDVEIELTFKEIGIRTKQDIGSNSGTRSKMMQWE